jgi:hypothetical protein
MITDNKVSVDNLMSVASLRAERLTRLLELAEEQRTILLQGKDSALPENVQAQEMITAELGQLQKREDSLFEALTSEGSAAGSDWRKDHRAIASKAARTGQRLRTVVRGNRALLDNAMQYVTFSLGVISSLASDQRQSYDPGSEVGATSLAIMLDRKV